MNQNMKTNAVPAVVMLSAGLIDCVVSIYQRLSLLNFTKQLLLVLVVFYILGCVVKMILDICLTKMNDLPQEAESEETNEESAEGEEGTVEKKESLSEEKLENIDAQEGE